MPYVHPDDYADTFHNATAEEEQAAWREAPLLGRGEAAEREWLSKHGADRFSRPSEEFLRETRRRDWLSDADDQLNDDWQD